MDMSKIVCNHGAPLICVESGKGRSGDRGRNAWVTYGVDNRVLPLSSCPGMLGATKPAA